MAISCPVCHTENDKDARYCRKCGKTLSHSLLEECVAIVQRYPDYSLSLDSAILQLLPYIQWGVTSLKNNNLAYKVGEEWHLRYDNDPNITLIHHRDYKTITSILLSKNCRINNLNPVFKCWESDLSISDWEILLTSARIKYDSFGFPESEDCKFFTLKLLEQFGQQLGTNFLAGIERSAFIMFHTSNFSVKLDFKAYTKEQQNTLESVTITYRHLEKESFWRRL